MPDAAQNEAITWGREPLLLIAGPGSGKTYTLVHRVQYLIQKNALAPDRILVITFTREAAKEMQGRFLSLCGEIGGETHFGTFHAVFFQILRQSFGYQTKDLMDHRQKMELIRSLLPKEKKGELDQEQMLLLEKELSHTEKAENGEDEDLSIRLGFDFSVFRKNYHKKKREIRALDFDDLMLETRRLLEKDERALKFWRNRFDAILVDEAQDMNPVQYDMIRLLYREDMRLFMVGDDDQSIYQFRGSDPSLLRHFTEDFKGGQIRFLTTNYRSTREIVTLSNHLILHNKNRFPKEIQAAQENTGRVSYVACKDSTEEATHLVNLFYGMQLRGEDISKEAVLFRNRVESEGLRRELLRRGIPYQYREDQKSIFLHFVYQDLESFLKIAASRGERRDFIRIFSRMDPFLPRELIGGCKNMDEIYQNARGTNFEDQLLLWKKKFEWVEKMTPYLGVQFIRKGMAYDEALKDEAFRQHRDFQELLQKVEEFQEMARGFSRLSQFLQEYERMKAREEERIQSKKEEKKGVHLLTFHGSKGLEFDRVHILDCCEGITPTKKATTGAMIEEERRMFYVALTRGKKEVTLYTIRENFNATYGPSRFLREMKEEIKAEPESHQISG